jgi:hypothetical protein
VLKFRKLDLMNSPNILFYEEELPENREEEVLPLVKKNYSLFHIKEKSPLDQKGQGNAVKRKW